MSSLILIATSVLLFLFPVLSSLKTRVRFVLVAQKFTRIERQSRRTVAGSRCSEDYEGSFHT
jgi:hypothetical protein